MAIKIAVGKENHPGEKRIALIPGVAKQLHELGATVEIESGLGNAVGYSDEDFQDTNITTDRKQLYQDADIILKVKPPLKDEIQYYKKDAILIGFLNPFQESPYIHALNEKNITSFAIELVPRISRAQNIDALSSQASVTGYKAVLMGASLSGKFFPMLTTAAGTIRPAKVLVIGAGVAGLQAIATAKRLGAIVEAYDVRPEVKEQIESLGAKFINVGIKAEGQGGYARELTDEEKQQQQTILNKHICAADVVVSTAAIPGRKAPLIIDKNTVDHMQAGAVIVDLAAEQGGNCELTKSGETIYHCSQKNQEIIIHGPINVASSLAVHASEMYAKNLLNFVRLLIKEGQLHLDWEDPILKQSVLTHAGDIKFNPA